MQPVSVPPKSGKVAFQQGLIFGVIQAIIASSVLLVNTFVNNSSGAFGVSLLLSSISFLTGLAAYFVAGILASKQTGKVRTGVFAGMWTGGVYGIIGFVVSMVLFFQINLPRTLDAANASGLYSNNMDTFKTGAMVGGVGFAIFGIVFAIGLGAGLGALGGLIGRNTSRFKVVPTAMPVYAVYPGQPMYPGQPVYPGQPMYPGQPVYPGQPAPYAAPAQATPYQPFVSGEQINSEQPVNNPYIEQ